MGRLERFGNIYNCLFFEVASCYALLMYLSLQYNDAEEILKLVKHCMEKVMHGEAMHGEGDAW
jgi:hypothetical protein